MDFLELLFKANTEELEGAEKTVEGLTEKCQDLAKEVPGIGSAFNALSSIGSSLSKVANEVNNLELTLLGTAAAATTAALAVGLLGAALAFKWSETIDEVQDLAEGFGYTASQVLLMKEAAESAGSSFQAIEAEYAKVAKAAFNANDPLKGTGAAFKQLGIDVNDSSGELKSAQEITEEAVKSWEEGSQSTADFAAMTQILGKSWEQNLPALQAVNEANKLANELQQEGIGISQESTKAVDDNKSANLVLKGVMSDVGSKLVESVIPAITNLTTWFTNSYREGGLVAGAFGALESATDGLVAVFKVLSSALQGVDFIVTSVMKGVGAAAAALTMLAHGDTAGAKNVWTEYLDDVGKSAEKAGKSITDLWTTADSHTIAAPKKGNSGHEGGESKEDPAKTVPIAPVAKVADDPYKALDDSLNKLLDTTLHYNEVQKAQVEIDKLNADQEAKNAQIDKENAAIDAFNAANSVKIANGQVQAKERIPQVNAQIAASERAIALVLAAQADAAKTTDLLTQGTKALKTETDAYTKSIDDQINPLTKTKDAIALENAQNKLKVDYEKTLEDLHKQGLDTDAARQQALDAYNASLNTLNASYAKQQAYEADFVGRGVDNYVKGLGTMNDATTKLVSDGLGDLETQLDNLATGGAFSFKAFAVSILDEIAKMIIQFTIMIPLANELKQALSGSSDGGWLSSIGSMFGGSSAASGATTSAGDIPLTAAAGGGDLTPGTSVLVGEKGPEMLTVGANGGTITPNSSLGGSSANITMNTPINITLTGGDLGSAADRALLMKQVQQTAEATFNKNLTQAMRPGGVLNRVR